MHRVETWKVDYAGIVYYIRQVYYTICDAEKVNFSICSKSNAIWISIQGISNRPVSHIQFTFLEIWIELTLTIYLASLILL